MSPRDVVDFSVPDDPQVVEAAARWSRLTAQDLGPELERFRAWPTGRFVGGLVGALLLGNVLCLLSPVGEPWALALVWTIAVLGCVLVFLPIGAREVQRVRVSGLQVGGARGRYLIPWDSIDPGRVHVLENGTPMGRQLDRILPATLRGGPLVTRALVVNGLNCVQWDPPFVNWVLGTAHPERLAAAIEAAMVADGYPAEGLAEHASRTSLTARWNPTGPLMSERDPKQPPLGLP